MRIGSFGFLGGGRITRIMLQGFARAGVLPEHLVVAEPNDLAFERLVEALPAHPVRRGDCLEAARQDLVFVGLHPPIIPEILPQIAPSLNPEAVLVSLAPRITLATMMELLGGFQRIARLLPNAPSIVNQGYNPVAFAGDLNPETRTALTNLFQTLGACPEIAEEKIEAYAVLVAMSPAYFWFQWQQLMTLGTSFGLNPDELKQALPAMIQGATATMFDGDLSPEEVMDLILVKPLQEEEPAIREIYTQRLTAMMHKLKS